MGLFQLIAQIMGLCGFVTAIALGLLTAPWYILIALLLIVMAVTRFLMPEQNIRISRLPKDVSDSVFEHSNNRRSPDTSSPNKVSSKPLMYRGVIYSKKENSNT